jgi:hypothetical protein
VIVGTHTSERRPPTERDRLEQFVKDRLARISGDLADRGEPVSDATMREVRFLRELTQLSAERKPISSPSRLVPIVMAVTGLCITALIFIPMQSIRIDLDLLCSGLRFRTPSPIELTGVSAISLLEAKELAPISLEDPETLASTQVEPPIELRPDAGGSLTLSSLIIPAGASVGLLASDNAGTWRLEIEHRDAVIGATATGRVHVAGSRFARGVEFGRGTPIQLRPTLTDLPRLGLFLTPAQTASVLTSSVIPVAGISFEQPIQSASQGVAGVVRADTSSVLDGTLFNVSLGGHEMALKKRDVVRMSVISGYLRELRLEPTGVRVSLSAEASELLVGRAGGVRSLRPSLLEWLAQRHGLQLAWTSGVWIFGLLLGGLRWWQGARA